MTAPVEASIIHTNLMAASPPSRLRVDRRIPGAVGLVDPDADEGGAHEVDRIPRLRTRVLGLIRFRGQFDYAACLSDVPPKDWTGSDFRTSLG
jgi:hypothetical protein